MLIHCGFSQRRLIVFIASLVPVTGFSQSLMPTAGAGGFVRIFGTDSAVLEAREPRKDLPCTVTPTKPFLGFDLRFHAGYDISIPLRELAGADDLLTIIFRVTPAAEDGVPVYFSQRVRVPPIDDDAKGSALLQGSFDLGEGKYQVDLLVRDRAERVCSHYWETEAALPAKDRDLAMNIAPNTAEPADKEPFKEEPPVDRAGNDPLKVKVLINFAPQNARAATLQPSDTNALISILRNIAREPRIGAFSLVAFNMQEQRVLYRQDEAPYIDFPTLGDAVENVKLGVVDVSKLGDKNSETAFLTDLITKELQSAERTDAIIFAGPKVMLDQPVPEEALRQMGKPEFPVFYMNYNFNPQNNPWRDAIGNAVRFFKGQEFTISRPRDLWFAWTEIMNRIVRLKERVSESASR